MTYSRPFLATPIPMAILTAIVSILPFRGSLAGETSMKSPPIPQTMNKMKELMGEDYIYLDKEGLFIVSDLDKKTLYPLMSRDFLIYLHVLQRDFFTKSHGATGNNSAPLLTIFLFRDRSGYIKGLRKIGISIAPEDENHTGAVRNGYYYGGKERNFILINYRENYSEGIATFSHELTHALIAREFRGAPKWLNEGMATMIGRSRIVNSHLRYSDHLGLNRMKKRVEKGEMPSLSAIVRLEGKDFSHRENSNPAYDSSAWLCRFLHSRNQLLPLYRELRDNAKKRDNDLEVIRRITGLDLDNLERAWHNWLMRQEEPPPPPVKKE